MARLARMCASQLPTTAGHDVDILGVGYAVVEFAAGIV